MEQIKEYKGFYKCTECSKSMNVATTKYKSVTVGLIYKGDGICRECLDLLIEIKWREHDKKTKWR